MVEVNVSFQSYLWPHQRKVSTAFGFNSDLLDISGEQVRLSAAFQSSLHTNQRRASTTVNFWLQTEIPFTHTSGK
jgi:hypothetical protein